MLLNNKTVARKKLIKVKRNWVVVSLMGIMLFGEQSANLINVKAQSVQVNTELELQRALKDEQIDAIKLNNDIELSQSENNLPLRNLKLDLDQHTLKFGIHRVSFSNDDFGELHNMNFDVYNSPKSNRLNEWVTSNANISVVESSTNSNHYLESIFPKTSATSSLSSENANSSLSDTDKSKANDFGEEANSLSANGNISHESSSVLKSSNSAMINNPSSSVVTNHVSSVVKTSNGASISENSSSKIIPASSSAQSSHISNTNQLSSSTKAASLSSTSVNIAASSISTTSNVMNSDLSISNPTSSSLNTPNSSSVSTSSANSDLHSLFDNRNADFNYNDTDTALSSNHVIESINQRPLILNLHFGLALPHGNKISDDYKNQLSPLIINNDKNMIPFNVNKHQITIKKKCYLYPDPTFNIKRRIKVVSRDEYDNHLITQHAYSKYGRLRYKVNGGYITAHPDFVTEVK